MASLVRRASSSKIRLAARSLRFSSLFPPVIRSHESSSLLSATISPECSSPVLHPCNRPFASSFLPFSTISANNPRAREEERYATAEESNYVPLEFPKNGNFNLQWESEDEIIGILVEEKKRDDNSETSLRMRIRVIYGDEYDDDSSKRMVFDVALPDDQGQAAIQNASTSVDDYFREYIRGHMDDFKGLLEKRGFNHKVDLAVKFARELKNFNKHFESKAKSARAIFPKPGKLTLNWQTEDEMIEIKVEENDSESGAEKRSLQMLVRFMYGDKFSKYIEFEVPSPEDKGQDIAIQHAKVSTDYIQPDSSLHLDEFTGVLEKRGFNDNVLDFVVKYAQELREVRKQLMVPYY